MINRIFPEFRQNRFESAEVELPFSGLHFDPRKAESTESAEADHDSYSESFDAEVGLLHQQPLLHEFDSGAVAYLPEGYEQNYAYPLIVWLPEENQMSTADFGGLMSGISSRNFLGLQLPAWVNPPRNEDDVADAVREHVTQVRQSWHVHTERIVLAGFRSAADLAVRAFLDRPEWFGGVIALFGNGGDRDSLQIPFRNPEIRGKRAFLATAAQSSEQPSAKTVTSVFHMGRILNTAGMDVSTRVYEVSDEPQTAMLSDINGWLIERLCVTA